jgi:hypothetical protein
MKKNPQDIVEQINALVSELAALAGASAGQSSASPRKRPSPAKNLSGATGGIRLLVRDGKLDSPQKLPEIMNLLKQEGRHYARPAVAMGLLNMVRERVLTRLQEKGDKNWKYVVRK